VTDPVRTLLVEDNPGDARLLRALLPDGFALVHVERLADALVAARETDVVLLDLSLPDSQGLETFRRLHAAVPDVPVLVLTGHDDSEGAVRAVREGAQDWLVKGHVETDLLGRALRYAIERNRLARRLAELDRMRALFLSVVSHDLKSPAASILAGIDLLLGGRIGELDPRQRRALDLMRRNALRQTRLVDDLLAVAVIEAGAMALHPAEVDLGVLVAQIAEELGPLAIERGVALRTEVSGATVLRADPDRLAQAVANLVANAVKFAGTEVVVRASAGTVVVEDDGPGLPPALVDHLFERFVRGEGERAGSGLGLSIVRGIAELHGGTVRAENRPEGGARFVLALSGG
jgi:signal transduction histidine kinase